jgi:hypothetical protein
MLRSWIELQAEKRAQVFAVEALAAQHEESLNSGGSI